MLFRNLAFCFSSSLFLCLTACNPVKSILGFDHEGPQEFDVIPLAPLSLPADFKKTPKTQERTPSQIQEQSTDSKNLQSVVLTEEEKKVVLASKSLQSRKKQDKELSKVLLEEVPEQQDFSPSKNIKEIKKDSTFLNKIPAQQTLKTGKKIEKEEQKESKKIKEPLKADVNKGRTNKEIPVSLVAGPHSKIDSYSASLSSSSYKFLDDLKIETDLFPTTELKQKEGALTKDNSPEGDFQSQVLEQTEDQQHPSKKRSAPQKTERKAPPIETKDSAGKAKQPTLGQADNNQAARQEVSLADKENVKTVKTSVKKNLQKKKKVQKRTRVTKLKRLRSKKFQLKKSSKRQDLSTVQKKRKKSSSRPRRIRKIPSKRQKSPSVSMLELDSSVS